MTIDYWAKFPHSPIHHYTSIYGALLFSVSPVRCTCIIKYGAVRKFFRAFTYSPQDQLHIFALLVMTNIPCTNIYKSMYMYFFFCL